MSMSLLPVLIAAVAGYVGCYHLLLYWRRPQRQADLTFAMVSLGLGAYCLASAGLYSVVTVEAGARWQKVQTLALCLGGVALMWFVADYIALRSRTVLWGLTGVYGIGFVVVAVERVGLTWTTVPAIKTLTLPVVGRVTYYEVQAGPLANLFSLLALVVFAYLIWETVRFYRAGQRRTAAPLLISLSLILIGVLNDGAVAAGLYRCVYLTEITYLTLVVLMAFSLSSQLVEAAQVKAALAQSEARLRLLLDSAGDIIAMLDRRGRFQYYNAAPQYDLADQVVLGRTPAEVFAPEWAQPMLEHLHQVVRSGLSLTYEAEATWNGRHYWFSNRMAPVRAETGQVMGVVLAAHNVTRHKEATEALRQSEARYRALAEAAHDIIFILDPAGIVRYINHFGASQLNTEPEAIIGQPMQLLFSPAVAEQQWQLVQQTLAQSEPRYVETESQYPLKTLWLGTWLVPLPDEHGQVWGVLGIARDITERRETEAALRESETRYRQLVAVMPDAIIVHSDGRIVFANPAAAKLWGAADEAALLGRPLLDVVHPAYRAVVVERVRRLLKDGGMVPLLEEKLIRADGTVVAAEVTAVGLSYQGRPAVLVVARDIREQKRAQAAEAEQRAVAETLRDTAAALNGTLHYAEVLDRILESVARVVPYDRASLLLLEQDTARVVRCRWAGEPQGEEFLGYCLTLAATPGLQRISQTGQPLVLAETHAAADWTPEPVWEWVRAWVGAPIARQGQLLGFLTVESATAGFYVAEHATRLLALADQAALALENARLLAETEHRLKRLVALRAIDRAISASLDLRVTLNMLLNHVITQLKVDAAVVLLLNPHMPVLEHAASQGFRSHDWQQLRINMGRGYLGRAALERRLVFVPNLDKQTDDLVQALSAAGEDFTAGCIVPLAAKGQTLGVLAVLQRAPLAPDPEWQDFLEALAIQAAIAIDNAALFDNLQRSNIDLALAYEATIEGWARTLELRDHATEGHAERVANVTVRLAHGLGIRDGRLLHMRRGALLHDIGKMAIPDSILLKAGPLSAAEWVEMRRHPVYAYELLSAIDFLRPALDIPYAHHEKWDGTGYPGRLAGEQIPQAARIFSVVDVWDALRSDRPYRAAWSVEQVRDHLRALAGVHFDPGVVEAFLKLEELQLPGD